ncbi:hypothetical protein DEJ09_10550 [Curtobacterium sp. MCLR17_055]|nr:hypothetical protein DEJ09_10550 [Curtobacterium sp. MCLR17_055]
MAFPPGSRPSDGRPGGPARLPGSAGGRQRGRVRGRAWPGRCARRGASRRGTTRRSRPPGRSRWTPTAPPPGSRRGRTRRHRSGRPRAPRHRSPA